jgi:two-component system sensor histidine kinase/response regulator
MAATLAEADAVRSGIIDHRAVIHLKESPPDTPRVLIVDDREYNVDILAKMLIRVGYQVQPALNGQEAVDQFASWRPQAILMDIRMPVLDGIESTRQIRALEQGYRLADSGQAFSQATIIAVSASALENQRKEILQPGLADGFISKPFKETEILEVLAKHLGVEYLYADAPPHKESDQAGLPPEVAAQGVADLPELLHSALQEATVNLDVDTLKDLLEQVQSRNSALATHMLRLIEVFNFDGLGQLLDSRK